MNEAEDQELLSRGNPLLWPLRFLLHWIIKIVVLLFMGIGFILRPKPIRYGIVALLGIGIIGWALAGPALSGRGVAAAGTSPASAPAAMQSSADQSSTTPISVPVNRTLTQPPVVEQYLKAQSNYDANGMWNTISDNLKQQLATNNTDEKALQAELDQAKQSGQHYGTPLYIGGVQIDSTSNAYFYVVTVETPNGTTRVPYIYVVDQNGKIDSIQ